MPQYQPLNSPHEEAYRLRRLRNGGASHARPNRGVTWLQRCLLAVGLSLLGYSAFIFARAEYDQAQGGRILDQMVSRAGSADGDRRITHAPVEGSLLGRIEVLRLGLTAIVFEGTTEGTLSRGVGHLAGSVAAGEAGNVVLAGHRDSFFRKLRAIERGDVVRVTTADGTFRYVVEATSIVQPDDMRVIKQGNDAILTLITCYPFQYIGNAPERFIVRGRRIDSPMENTAYTSNR